MKIFARLEELYPNTRWYGPYVRDDGRSYLVRVDTTNGLVTKKAKKCSVMLARAKLEVKLGRRLLKTEEADHKDENPLNDAYSNLQPLSKIDNLKKSSHRNTQRQTRKEVVCPKCRTIFICPAHRIRAAKERKRKPCCSRSCSSQYYGGNQYSVWG